MSNENLIINRIKYFQIEYPDGVPLNILKLDLGISVPELQNYILSLEEQGILFIENEEYVKLVETSTDDFDEKSEDLDEEKTNMMDLITAEPNVEIAKTYDLTEREINALKIIKDLTDESGHIPRYIMEGTLLYGDLKLSMLSVYNLIMSLENKGIIKQIKVGDSEYFTI